MVSKHVDLEGPVHYLDFGGEGPPLVCVHGLAGSALNWIAVAHALAAGHRVLAPDLRGFGSTPWGPGSRLRDNQRLLDLFLREVAGTPATLMGSSMGGLLSVRQAAASPETVSRLVLVAPALPWRGRRPLELSTWSFFAAMLVPGVDRAYGHAARQLGPERVVAEVLRICCADPTRVAPDVVRAHVEQEAERLIWPRSQRAVAQASRSLLWALGRRGLMRTYGVVRAPVLVVHGERDKLVPAAFSLAIGHRYSWQVELLPGVGHIPMMEAPDEFMRVTLGWLTSQQPAAA